MAASLVRIPSLAQIENNESLEMYIQLFILSSLEKI
jgi:hypothetical protein